MKVSNVGVVVLMFSVVSFASCGDDGSGPCDQFNWRGETANATVCPLTADCLCSGSDVCCAIWAGEDVTSASCSSLELCVGLAFECDGPEDCLEGESCCSVMTTGGGSSCKTTTDCFGTDEIILCRKDEDCTLGDNCLPAGSGGYFEGVVGYCK